MGYASMIREDNSRKGEKVQYFNYWGNGARNTLTIDRIITDFGKPISYIGWDPDGYEVTILPGQLFPDYIPEKEY